MFRDRKNWRYVTDQQKNDYFFIINRYMSKKYPKESLLLNNKMIDKVSAMDTWFLFMNNNPYPKWFWSKSLSDKSDSDFSKNDILLLLEKFSLKEEELTILMKFHPDVVKDELSYYKSIQKKEK